MNFNPSRVFLCLFVLVTAYNPAGAVSRERQALFNGVDLDNWQGLTETPAVLEIRREALGDLVRFRESMADGSLAEDFYIDRIFGRSRVWLGLWESTVAHISWTTSEVST